MAAAATPRSEVSGMTLFALFHRLTDVGAAIARLRGDQEESEQLLTKGTEVVERLLVLYGGDPSTRTDLGMIRAALERLASPASQHDPHRPIHADEMKELFECLRDDLRKYRIPDDFDSHL